MIIIIFTKRIYTFAAITNQNEEPQRQPTVGEKKSEYTKRKHRWKQRNSVNLKAKRIIKRKEEKYGNEKR